ncbi:MAG: hypothetical protein WC489_02810 [Patescibacteria group bacterium]
MDTNKQKIQPKKLIILTLLLIIISIAGYIVLAKKPGSSSTKQIGGVLNNEEGVIPTVDSSVSVELTTAKGKQDVVLTISGIPPGTELIDYELSYEERQKGLQGVIGIITTEDKDSYEKTITLGTCSSGKCVYHDVIGKIKVTLKFSGSYGEKIFEKEYDI